MKTSSVAAVEEIWAPTVAAAELQTSAIPEGEIRLIPLRQLRESPWNPRQYFPEAAMAELVESMKQSGFRQWLPLMVRPLPADVFRPVDGKDYFEVGAGHRRRRAALEAGLEFVPCIVRTMTDEEFLDVLNFDNCGREDVHPLHEASGWRAWMEKTGKGVGDIAARIGQSKEYVYQRLKYADLIPEARKVFLDNGITAGHAVLIARVPSPEDQKKALKYCEPNWGGVRASVRQLAEFIAQDIHLELSDAAFDLESETLLPAAGPCTTCPKRTGNLAPLVMPELAPPAGAEQEDDPDKDDDWDDPDAPDLGADACTEPACFKAKLDAHLIQVKAKLSAKGQAPVEVSGGYGKAPKGVLNRSAYIEVTKGDAGQIAIIKDGLNAGKIIHIKLLSDERAEHGQKRKDEEAQQDKRAADERAVRWKILEAVRAKTGSRLMKWEVAELIELALDNMQTLPGAFDLCRVRGIEVPDLQSNQPSQSSDDLGTDSLIKALPSLSEAEMFRLAIELPVMEDFERFTLIRNDPPRKLLALAKSHGIDAVKIRREMTEAQKAAEGGTRREVEKAPAHAKKKASAKAKSAKAKTPPAKKKPAAKPAKKKTGK